MENERHDLVTFYKDKDREWRWTRRAPNGETAGASHEGFKNFKDAKNNAFRQMTKFDIDVAEIEEKKDETVPTE